MLRLLLPAVLWTAACAQPDPKSATDTASVGASDADGDGFAQEEGDCDDADRDVNPAAVETCDGVDQDCDGDVDEGTRQRWYLDADVDGFGDPDVFTEACELPQGHVVTGTDCDDADGTVFPTADEVCDAVDNDCDGDVDEGVGVSGYLDSDGDGFGDPAQPWVGCERPAGVVEDGGDCADDDPDSNPRAPEVCDETDNDCDGEVDEGVQTTWWADLDGDGWGGDALSQLACVEPTGYASTAGDCDDANGDISPSGLETCNGVDDDCDGTVDVAATGAPRWYADGDADGHGDLTRAQEACSQPSGWVALSDDCDDTRGDVAPSVAESCDGVDNDCDGTSDESTASDARTWYLDYDGDGHGGTRISTVACTASAGFVASADDCDDTEAGVSPSASETCDGIDEDCDGTVDDGVASSTWYRDADGDGWGSSASTTSACSAPSGHVARAGDCDDTSGAVSPSASETCNGRDDDCDGVVDDGTADSDGDGTCDGLDAESCDGMDNDGDGLGDEGLTCTYRLVQSDLSSGLCVDDEVYVNVNGSRVYTDPTYGAGCGHVVTFTATPGDTVDVWAVDSVGGCRSMTDVYIVNVAGGVGQLAASGYSNTCGHGASSSAFWSARFAVPGLF